MITKKTIWNLIKGTLLSMLVFFTLSFFSVIYSIKHPENYVEVAEMHIGFPFSYYYQFWLSGSDGPNWGGNYLNLLLDCFICWTVVTGIYLLLRREKK